MKLFASLRETRLRNKIKLFESAFRAKTQRSAKTQILDLNMVSFLASTSSRHLCRTL
jgi:hypothetical protein